MERTIEAALAAADAALDRDAEDWHAAAAAAAVELGAWSLPPELWPAPADPDDDESVGVLERADALWWLRFDDHDALQLVRIPPRVRNLTSRALRFVAPDGREAVLLPDPAGPARVDVTMERIGEIDLGSIEVPLVQRKFGAASGLPEPSRNRWLIVSRVIAAAFPDREDLLTVEDVVRDEARRVVAARTLMRGSTNE